MCIQEVVIQLKNLNESAILAHILTSMIFLQGKIEIISHGGSRKSALLHNPAVIIFYYCIFQK